MPPYDGSDLTTALDGTAIIAGINVRARAAHMHRALAVAADKNLILWTASPAPTPGGSDVLHAAHAYTYFQLNPATSDVTVTLPDPTLMDWPITFINGGASTFDVVFASQQSPSVRTDGATMNDLSLDGFKLAPFSAVTLAPSKNATGEWDILWHDMYYEKVITSADSPYTAKWWERSIRADATAGAITVTLSSVLKGLPWATNCIKTDVSANVVTVEGVALAAQDDAASFRYSAIGSTQEVIGKP